MGNMKIWHFIDELLSEISANMINILEILVFELDSMGNSRLYLELALTTELTCDLNIRLPLSIHAYKGNDIMTLESLRI